MTRPRTAPAPLPAALVLAAAAGPVLAAAFPSQGWWPLAFVGIAAILLSLRGRRAGSALLVGFAAGLSFYFSSIFWISLYLGPLPLIALAVFESLFFAAGSLLIALAYRWAPIAWPGRAGRLLLTPVVVAGLWTARESFSSVWPYGGFPWARVVGSQSEGPFAHLVAWFGFAGVGFLVVLISAVALECLLAVRLRPSLRAATAAAVVAAVLAVPAWPVATAGTMRIAAVQGDGPAGYFEPSNPGDVMNSQIQATLPLFGAKRKPDLVVWPEGSADVDPSRNRYSAKALDEISSSLDAPIIAATVTHRHGKYYNTSFLWEPGHGMVDLYDKKHPVPFGEYIPDRAFWRPFAPGLIDLVQREYTPGTRGNVFDVHGVRAGISICFDIADDSLLTEMLQGGAQVILAQTNNADFGHTEENEQQLAYARLRAIEAGRSLVNISTVGTSQIVAPDGATITGIRAYRPGHMVADVPLSTTTTPAALTSRGTELLVAGLGVGGLLVAAGAARARRRRRRG